MTAYTVAWTALRFSPAHPGGPVLVLASGIAFAEDRDGAIDIVMGWNKRDFPVSKGFFGHFVVVNEILEHTALGILIHTRESN